jgi:hypothetical protein
LILAKMNPAHVPKQACSDAQQKETSRGEHCHSQNHPDFSHYFQKAFDRCLDARPLAHHRQRNCCNQAITLIDPRSTGEMGMFQQQSVMSWLPVMDKRNVEYWIASGYSLGKALICEILNCSAPTALGLLAAPNPSGDLSDCHAGIRRSGSAILGDTLESRDDS